MILGTLHWPLNPLPATVTALKSVGHPALPILQDYKATQKIAAEREAQYMPKVPPAAAPRPGASSSSSAAAAAAAAAHGGSEADMEAEALLQEQKLQQSRALENTIEFQEALIEERDHGIAGGAECAATYCVTRNLQHAWLRCCTCYAAWPT
jgi:hypothetical protein